MSRKLITVQKDNKLNDVFAVDDPGAGGANHKYKIVTFVGEVEDCLCNIEFQHGPRRDINSVHGVLDTDLLEIVRDRLAAFQQGDFACQENAFALQHIEEALLWMNLRVANRAERNVLGTNNK